TALDVRRDGRRCGSDGAALRVFRRGLREHMPARRDALRWLLARHELHLRRRRAHRAELPDLLDPDRISVTDPQLVREVPPRESGWRSAAGTAPFASRQG